MKPQIRRTLFTAPRPTPSGIGSAGGVAVSLILAAVLVFCFAGASMAQITASPILTNTLLAKAEPDECFAGVGAPYPSMENGKCPKGSVPKMNQAYVWGLTQVQSKLWFGTAPNVLCLVLGGYLGQTEPVQTDSYVCEFGYGQVAQTYPNLPDAVGDWRPPRAYVYNLAGKGSLTDVTPADSRFVMTLGLRSAGSIGDTVFLAGPALGTGVNFFAFRSSDQQYLGSCNATAFNNIRQWAVVHDNLYAGVGNVAGGGGVVRWNGSESQPFDAGQSLTCGFEVVGNLPRDAAFLTAYGPTSDRIAASAWPNKVGLVGAMGAGVYISPKMTDTGTGLGLTSADADSWNPIWSSSGYDPDPVTAATYGGGAIAYWNGALYFGTMHVPGVSTIAHIQAYGQPADQAEFLEVAAGTHRAISIWRIRDADTVPVAELLYGESSLPAYDAVNDTFQLQPTGFTPSYGSSGFGNPMNNYTWTASVFKGRLFFGTMDWSYLLSQGAIPLLPADFDLKQLGLKEQDIENLWGADLWRFDSDGPAVAEDLGGLKNYLNYGLRSMITAPDGQRLFVGTANPMNLEPDGGWELRALTLKK